MKIRRYAIAGFLASLPLLSLSSAGFAACPSAKPLAAHENSFAADAVKAGKTAGVVVAVTCNGSAVFEKAFGSADLENNVPLSTDHVFRIGSVSKEFTAAAILLLAEDKELSLDEPLSKFLPKFPRASEVTLRQLMTHTSGIHDFTQIPNFVGRDWRLDHDESQMLELIGQQSKLYDFEPGTNWSYSNSGFYLLGLVIERVTGRPYAEFLRNRIFDAIGLKHTAVDNDTVILPRRAQGYDPIEGSPGSLSHAMWMSMTVPGAAGSLRTTVGDLIRWRKALFEGRVLQPQSLEQMITPARLKDGKRIVLPKRDNGLDEQMFEGLGVSIGIIGDHRSVIGSGVIPGYDAKISTSVGDRLTVVVLANTLGGAGAIFEDARKAILDQHTCAPASSWAPKGTKRAH